MTAIVNKYFNKESALEQTLFNKIKSEAIQIMGHKFYYLPREVQVQDLILGEDVVTKFSLAIPIEMYMQDVQGFQGDREMFSKFGLQIQNSFTLIVAQDRWEKEVKSQFDNVSANGEALFDVLNNKRPQEGDLIYDPLTKGLYEIKFVDHDYEFYQLGKNYLYHLNVEAYQYNSSTIDTGIPDIDIFESDSTDLLKSQLMTELSEILMQEDCDQSILLEDGNNTTTKIMDYGKDFTSAADQFNVTVENPFGG